MLWTYVVVMHTNVAMSDFEVATFMFVKITQPVCLAFFVGLTFVFVFMAKTFNFVFHWVPKTVSLPFFARFIKYFVFFFLLLIEKRRDLCLFPMLWTSVVVLDTKDVNFLLPCIRKNVLLLFVYFLSSTIYFGPFSLC